MDQSLLRHSLLRHSLLRISLLRISPLPVDGEKPRQRIRTGRGQTGWGRGFTLVELMITLSLGLLLAGVMIRVLLGESANSKRFGRYLRERQTTQRGLQLIRDELQLALAAAPQVPNTANRTGCGLAGRQVVLHLTMPQNPTGPSATGQGTTQQAGAESPGGTSSDITYSIERNPSAIWRGQALMRCGPAYGVDGQLSDGKVSSDVWLDGLTANGFQINPQGATASEGRGMLVMTIRQQFGEASGSGSASAQMMQTQQEMTANNWRPE